MEKFILKVLLFLKTRLYATYLICISIITSEIY